MHVGHTFSRIMLKIAEVFFGPYGFFFNILIFKNRSLLKKMQEIVAMCLTDTCCLDLGLDIRMPSSSYSNDTGRLPCTTPSLDQVGIRLERVVALVPPGNLGRRNPREMPGNNNVFGGCKR